ncbi:LPXTG cell wall anchor domain-containing protein [Actinoplanes sp. NPDC023714]|uniref:LPXTG cell wall anchor domain-containing protein n=1 Tax=Actinoplanes sp. NPDC023714 TaxID=3154322 RepID=UPI0033DAEC00
MSRIAGLIAAAVLVFVAPAPAQAAPVTGVEVRVEDVRLTPGAESTRVEVFLYSEKAVDLGTSGGVSLELSGGLTGVVLSGNLRMYPCEDTVGPALSCTLEASQLPAGGASAGFTGFISAAEDAALGQEGTLTVTVSAPNLAPVTGAAKVFVGPAASPSASASASVSASASPSASASASPSVSAGASSPSASASVTPSASIIPSASVSSSPAAGGGALPITGPQGGTFAVAGGVLVVAGALGFLLARRRRARFEA